MHSNKYTCKDTYIQAGKQTDRCNVPKSWGVLDYAAGLGLQGLNSLEVNIG